MIRNDNKGEKVMNYIELLSVGCLLTKDLKVFPINCNEPVSYTHLTLPTNREV